MCVRSVRARARQHLTLCFFLGFDYIYDAPAVCREPRHFLREFVVEKRNEFLRECAEDRGQEREEIRAEKRHVERRGIDGAVVWRDAVGGGARQGGR